MARELSPRQRARVSQVLETHGGYLDALARAFARREWADIAQDARLRLCERLDRRSMHPQRMRAFIWYLVRNASANAHRRVTLQSRVTESVSQLTAGREPTTPPHEEALIIDERQRLLEMQVSIALTQLTVRQRRAARQIMHGTPVSVVDAESEYAARYRARRRLRHLLDA